MRISKNENNENSNPYRQQRKQVQQIVRRIDKKRSMQIFIERSQGSLIENQFRNKRKTQIKLQEQLKKSQQRQNLKKRMVQKRNTICFNFTHAHESPKSNHRHATQSPRKLADVILRERQNQILKQNISLVNTNVETLIVKLGKQNSASMPVVQQQPIIPNLQVPLHKKYGLRPALEQLQNYLGQKDKVLLERRRRIVQMLVLCLMRRCHKKLYEALDIALETSIYFQQENNQILLKSICLKLIGKLYKQIHLKQKRTRVSLESKVKNSSSKKFRKKRHSSFMIKTLASQRMFFTRFANKYHKSKLLRETSYQKQQQKMKQPLLKKTSNGIISRSSTYFAQNISQVNMQAKDQIIQEQSNNNNKIYTKLSKNLAISLPSPSDLFQQSTNTNTQQCQNYGIIIHQRGGTDSTSKLFPYQYPSSLQKIIPKSQYIYLVSAINSIMFTQTQCYDFEQVFRKYITQTIIMVIVIMIIFIDLVRFDSSSIQEWLIQCGLFCGLVVNCSYFLKNTESSISGSGERYERMEKQLNKWNRRYFKNKIIFKTTQNCQALIICFQTQKEPDMGTQSQMFEADSINQSSLESQIEQSLNLNRQSSNVLYENNQYIFENLNKQSLKQITSNSIKKGQPNIENQCIKLGYQVSTTLSINKKKKSLRLFDVNNFNLKKPSIYEDFEGESKQNKQKKHTQKNIQYKQIKQIFIMGEQNSNTSFSNCNHNQVDKVSNNESEERQYRGFNKNNQPNRQTTKKRFQFNFYQFDGESQAREIQKQKQQSQQTTSDIQIKNFHSDYQSQNLDISDFDIDSQPEDHVIDNFYS